MKTICEHCGKVITGPMVTDNDMDLSTGKIVQRHLHLDCLDSYLENLGAVLM